MGVARRACDLPPGANASPHRRGARLRVRRVRVSALGSRSRDTGQPLRTLGGWPGSGKASVARRPCGVAPPRVRVGRARRRVGGASGDQMRRSPEPQRPCAKKQPTSGARDVGGPGVCISTDALSPLSGAAPTLFAQSGKDTMFVVIPETAEWDRTHACIPTYRCLETVQGRRSSHVCGIVPRRRRSPLGQPRVYPSIRNEHPHPSGESSRKSALTDEGQCCCSDVDILCWDFSCERCVHLGRAHEACFLQPWCPPKGPGPVSGGGRVRGRVAGGG